MREFMESWPPGARADVGGPAVSGARLLPWPGPDGGACYLRSDECDALWRLADEMESVQLGMGRELLGFVRRTLAEATPWDCELQGMVAHLCTALSDALRVADSRGALLGLPGSRDRVGSTVDVSR
ncbi:hypothetical protein [Streptomyces sp. NBC_00448]|uniref:hypothetical protein n=1 Tax=Streptomyces sp. NBC_00448 TaxID=2903652 RepID=UPI002E2367DF